MGIIKRPGEVTISRLSSALYTKIRVEILDPETRAMVWSQSCGRRWRSAWRTEV